MQLHNAVVVQPFYQYQGDTVQTLDGKFATDTLWSKSRSIAGNIASQLYTHNNGSAAPYHLHEANGDTVGYSLSSFLHDNREPSHLTFDGIPTQTGHNTLSMQNIRRTQISFHISALYSPNENPEECCICKIKRRIYRIMHKKKIPHRL